MACLPYHIEEQIIRYLLNTNVKKNTLLFLLDKLDVIPDEAIRHPITTLDKYFLKFYIVKNNLNEISLLKYLISPNKIHQRPQKLLLYDLAKNKQLNYVINNITDPECELIITFRVIFNLVDCFNEKLTSKIYLYLWKNIIRYGDVSHFIIIPVSKKDCNNGSILKARRHFKITFEDLFQYNNDPSVCGIIQTFHKYIDMPNLIYELINRDYYYSFIEYTIICKQHKYITLYEISDIIPDHYNGIFKKLL